ncbi:MAG: hypothetical protein COY58_04365 [Gammaproteobacteria bacterium CG_4_10_14_0_8_um_filter_38_16]|nr:MAG: hypothetical protein COY58_04365 [Gammaproteobacteria bacterium CG_4_10_14_0_8_um_filter_38_16]PJA02591.1 MAG: hypothetical protein COX72_09585 [Gammaproteobacteria bacterium CG_4_10_14_0_2_um_filter_38_22]PJB09979.1 MAG: hypothetical protein CO120_07250 [Gammaproteobacteria bacterium CG_4_9_14_3_um_filter_38_9]
MQYKKGMAVFLLLMGFCFGTTALAAKALQHSSSTGARCENGSPYNGPWKNETGVNVYAPKFVCQNDLAIKHSNQCWGVYNASPSQPTVMGLYSGNYHTGTPLKTGKVYANQEFIPTCADLYRQCLLDANCKKCLDGSCG